MEQEEGKQKPEGTEEAKPGSAEIAKEEPKKEEAPKKEEPKKEEAPKKEEPKKEEAPKKEEPKRQKKPKTLNCLKCNKALKKGMWYYRDSKYFCNKSCWKAWKPKAAPKKEEPPKNEKGAQ